MKTGKTTIICGGRLLDARAHKADRADILIGGDTIRDVGRPGLPAPEGAAVIDARGKLLHPGLVNAHTHGHGNLGTAMVDRWTLELVQRRAGRDGRRVTDQERHPDAFLVGEPALDAEEEAVADGVELRAVARWEPAETPGSPEMALVVEDAWQGRRLGTELLGRLLETARARGEFSCAKPT